MDKNIELVAGSVKTAMKGAGATSSDLWMVAVDKIRIIPGFNVRQDTPAYRGKIRQLADSIKLDGYMRDKPMAGYVAREDVDGVANDVIFLTDGHTRMAALQLAADEGCIVERVPVITKAAGTSMEDLDVALAKGNTEGKLTPYETGLVCKRLIGRGLEPADVAARLGMETGYVRDLLGLVAAPAAVRKLVIEGTVSSTLAIDMLQKHGADAIKYLEAGERTAVAAGATRVTAKHIAAVGKPVAKESPSVKMKRYEAALQKLEIMTEKITDGPGLIVKNLVLDALHPKA